MENTFITFEKALQILKAQKEEFPIVQRPIAQCAGSFLAEDLVADRDFPPFNRVTMDGIAISYASFKTGNRSFKIEQTTAAGSPQVTLKESNACIEIMTGAILPKNTDTVIRYEDLEIKNGEARLQVSALKEAQNVHFKGMDIAMGSPIVSKGRRISSAEINIAAAIGKANLAVKKMPKTAIISTGDELVAIDETPELHQIRRSNVYGIRNTLQEWGISADLEHLPDNKPQMLTAIKTLLQNYDLLVFTGGVSKGKFDHLPEVLDLLKVKRHFHKIQQRPGKPFWFGSSLNHKKIFALPGNPVSSFVCVYVYLRYWLLQSLGVEIQNTYVKLSEDVTFTPNLVYFPEAQITNTADGSFSAKVIIGNGSGDFANLVKTNGFLVLPQDRAIFRKGEVYPFIPYRLKL